MIAPARKNILIVEDDQSIADEMTKTLERMDCDVTGVFASGEEFMEKAAKLPCTDLVIMDVSLAGALDGIQTGKYVESQLKLPVIYITGYRYKAAMLEEKGRVPLLKPFTTDDLRAAIGVVFYRLSLREMEDPVTDREIPAPQKPDLNLNI
ncbi:MAG: response regulator [Candidatus Omnitrophica bacterium]|nr:response regulator [Candidatus Omnitrophota bacterium]